MESILYVDFNFQVSVVILIFKTLKTCLHSDIKSNLQSVISVQRKHILNIDVTFLFLFSIVAIVV